MSHLLSADVHAIYWPPLTARAWRILNWLRCEGAPRSRYAIASTLNIPPSALTALAPVLLAAGLVCEVRREDKNSTYAPLLDLTKKGRIVGKKRRIESLVATVAPMPDPVPRVAISPRAIRLLGYLHERLLAGEVPTTKDIAARLKVGSKNGLAVYAQLVAAGLALPSADTARGLARARLTSLGLAAARAEVPIIQAADAPDPVRAPVKKKTPERPHKPVPVAAVEPLPAPVVAMPETFGTFRGIRHPAPPPAFAPHNGMGRSYYDGLTTVPSMARVLEA